MYAFFFRDAASIVQRGGAGTSGEQQADGKLVVVGQALSARGDFDFAVVRLNGDGSLDTSFNATGKRVDNIPFKLVVTTPFSIVTTTNPFGDNRATAVLVRADGKILVGGSMNCGTPPPSVGPCAPFISASNDPAPSVTILRLLADGSIDASFGSQGSGAFNAESSLGELTSLLQLSDGRIFATASTSVLALSAEGMSYLRSDPATVTGAVAQVGLSASVDADGHVLIAGAGFAFDPSYSSLLMRSLILRLDETLQTDTAFGTGGGALGAGGDVTSLAASLLQERGNKIVAAGYLSRSAQADSPQDGMVIRLNTDGTPDLNFASQVLWPWTSVTALHAPRGSWLSCVQAMAN